MIRSTLLLFTILFFSTSQGQVNLPSVKIGTQIWMNKNLDVDHYRNGDPIPEVKDKEKWAKLTTGAWCYYENDHVVSKKYGKLYNWYAVNDPRGLAPLGWRIPNKDELFTLMYIPASNRNGFSGLPGGLRDSETGRFESVGIKGNGYWWSATERDSEVAWYSYLNFPNNEFYGASTSKGTGFSVRCIKK